MMQYTDQQIEAYLENTIAIDEIITLEEATKRDSELAYRVEAYRIIIESIRYAGFKENIQRIEANQKKQPRRLSFLGKVAASTILLIVASWIIDVLLVGSIFSDSANSGTMHNNVIELNIIDDFYKIQKDTTICLPDIE